MKHKHADTIIAWANGAEIEFRYRLANGDWSAWAASNPSWEEVYEYRVKPVVVVVYGNLGLGCRSVEWGLEKYSSVDNVKATFDKATGKLLFIEVVN